MDKNISIVIPVFNSEKTLIELHKQLIRLNRLNIVHFIHYGIVGASLNLFGFLIYLVMTWLGMEQ